MSEIRLKSCPFCGSEVYIEDLGVEKGDHYYMMQCTNEDCDAATCFGEKNKEKFIETWNTRKPMERIVERLEEEKETHKFLIQHASKTGTFIEKRQHEKAVEVCDRAIEIVRQVG